MRKKRWMLWAGLIIMIAVVITGSVYAFTRPHEMAQQKIKKVSTVQSSLKVSEKKVEAKVSKSSTVSSTSESTTQSSQTAKSTAQSETQNSKADLKAFNQKATAEEVYVKYPYGRTMNFERATDEKLKVLEKEYTLKEMTNLRDDYDGQTKSVIIFE
ncbi:hypothetical protein [Lactococcus sp. NH2-7C]|uniref:hypothetical protein n=1 Tax=Lactococcus sp. NH2-7C TaxID=2879149 RepID=UPI001CDC6F7F|nr:hypothetical protein [Lactococcus sp. NH2-7C]MCA2390128.1 hypothetical protein [Lactococcus sp. NH2-7C]WGV29608.1 hypothetical protein QJV49_08710 [Lactococcus sp. NH2-7C]